MRRRRDRHRKGERFLRIKKHVLQWLTNSTLAEPPIFGQEMYHVLYDLEELQDPECDRLYIQKASEVVHQIGRARDYRFHPKDEWHWHIDYILQGRYPLSRIPLWVREQAYNLYYIKTSEGIEHLLLPDVEAEDWSPVYRQEPDPNKDLPVGWDEYPWDFSDLDYPNPPFPGLDYKLIPITNRRDVLRLIERTGIRACDDSKVFQKNAYFYRVNGSRPFGLELTRVKIPPMADIFEPIILGKEIWYVSEISCKGKNAKMDGETIRIITEWCLEHRIPFIPTHGDTDVRDEIYRKQWEIYKSESTLPNRILAKLYFYPSQVPLFPMLEMVWNVPGLRVILEEWKEIFYRNLRFLWFLHSTEILDRFRIEYLKKYEAGNRIDRLDWNNQDRSEVQEIPGRYWNEASHWFKATEDPNRIFGTLDWDQTDESEFIYQFMKKHLDRMSYSRLFGTPPFPAYIEPCYKTQVTPITHDRDFYILRKAIDVKLREGDEWEMLRGNYWIYRVHGNCFGYVAIWKDKDREIDQWRFSSLHCADRWGWDVERETNFAYAVRSWLEENGIVRPAGPLM